MRRRSGIIVIAVNCFLYAGYMGAEAVWTLLSPRSIAANPSVELLQQSPKFGRIVPYLAIIVGLGWTLIGRGLLQFRNWARWAMILVATWGIVSALAPKLYYSLLWWPFLLVALQIVVRVVVVIYLLRASVARQFSPSVKAA